MVTMEELRAAAHKQGFDSLGDVDRAVLQADGFLSFFGKKPSDEDTRHRELMDASKALREAVATLQANK